MYRKNTCGAFLFADKLINHTKLPIISVVMILKRYIKRDKSPGDTLFVIFDEFGNELYYFSKTKNSYILTGVNGQKLLKIKELPFPKLCAYSISTADNNIKFFMNPQKNNSYFYGTAWQIRGDVFSGSFDIIGADNSLVCSREKSFMDGRSCCMLDIKAEHSELLCLGTAICAQLHAKIENLCVQTV